MPRNAEETMKALERVLPIFYRATLAGVREVNNGYSDTAHIHRQTTKSSLRRDHIVHILRGDLADDGGVHIDDRNQTTYFLIDREFHLLAKKSDELGSVALNDTQAALGFHCNEQQLVLDGDLFPEVTNLYLSYVPNKSDPDSPTVLLICPREGGSHWMRELEPPPASIAGEIGSVPPTPDQPDDLIGLFLEEAGRERVVLCVDHSIRTCSRWRETLEE